MPDLAQHCRSAFRILNRPSCWIVIVAVASMITPAIPTTAKAKDVRGFALNAVHKTIAARHRAIQHIAPERLAKLQRENSSDILLIDVREPAEHAVSHLGNAVQVSPKIAPSDFLDKFAPQMAGRKVVFYCSVGARSSSLATRIAKALEKTQQGRERQLEAELYNLSGGIFNWHNQDRKLVNSLGPTELVHPYSWTWSQLVERRELTSYEPTNTRPTHDNAPPASKPPETSKPADK